jgi:hypothetical protein
MTISYRGTADFLEIDHEQHRIRVHARGRERTGAGSADLSMQCAVTAEREGTSEVSLEATVAVTGKLVTLGRGMIGVVSEQVLAEFTSCLAAKLSGRGSTAAAAASRPTAPARGPTPAPTANALAILWRAIVRWLTRLIRSS